ncbi:ATP-dependent RNA helicase HrpA [Rhodococcus rhodnii]|uniref:RNA helicase n=2 Tax=Rhodococcus rhodnii TaxID=38312 RepID=R7WVP1_9NOCA|nr:ATP-dependent RNA helicase HrpA [Rhodococcus rhodnii]EOM78239.1 ATP-dependent helicase hrpA [Rhodococcus rhodnii LMG 5362]TXG90921.1 ATP-dependent RNA helicase HrpA [Rhodococcus rhodnii]
MSTHHRTASDTPSRAELKKRLSEVSIADAARLRRTIDKARDEQALARAAQRLDAAAARVASRAAAVPPVSFPAELPVSARRDDIAAAIERHQVVIVAGETGSGKTTQIPKICLQLGRGVRGRIGHTQPRRLAARSVADRIAHELGVELGGAVGYAVRFTDKVADDTLVKLMTDGILLAEIQRDRMLRAYDTIIIDEAHERSLNIDFILGYLAQLLPRRPDLKVIVTSATIDPERFAQHFAVDGVPAPIVEVSGRTYPVEVRYRPLAVATGGDDEDDRAEPLGIVDRDPVDAICDAVRELLAEPPGDILVFLSGEREIRDTADALAELTLRNLEILPLYARLSAAEQNRVFTSHTGRRVVLATNVAETSLTVPGIRYVVDPGTARISRYSVRTKVQRLPIEPVSQASARQRTGRCGRVADGICIRLYSEEDFLSRPPFTEPEILRTNLASVILQMAALGLGDIAAFPFVEPPDPRAIRDGIAVLEELGALEPGSRGDDPTLTPTGRDLARIPVDPRMARMLVQARHEGALRELLVIVAALSIQDVRERPAEHRQAADEKHARFDADGSDFLAYLALWRYLREQRDALSSNRFRRMCRDEYLHYLRIREWHDLHGQLRRITRDLGWTEADAPAGPDAVHRSLLSGLLSHIGLREGETREFAGARGSKFVVFPGSSLAKKPPRWVMAAELVETSRLFGRTVGRIEPEWAERLAGPLVKRTHSEPHWSSRRGATMAYERVTLFGVPLVAKRAVDYGAIDPEVAREMFIRHALVDGEWTTHHRFFHDNKALLDDVEELEHRARRRDIVVDDDALHDFYDERIPADVVSARHFDAWWKKARRRDPDLLDFTTATVLNADAAAVSAREFPDAWRQGDVQFPLSYQFEPGHDDDGVTATIPVATLGVVRPVGFDWLVPGMRSDLAVALIKTLPKHLRRQVVPAPDFAEAALAAVTPRSEPIASALARELSRLGGLDIAADDFDPTALPAHLRMTFVVRDEEGRELGRGKDLAALRRSLAPKVRAEVSRAATGAERPPATTWTADTLGTLAPSVTRTLAGQQVTGHPALAVEGPGVAVRVFTTEAEARAAHRAGLRTLLVHALPLTTRSAVGGLGNADRLTLGANPDGSIDALVDDCKRAVADRAVATYDSPVRSPEEFARFTEHVRPGFARGVAALARSLVPVLEADRRVRALLDGGSGDAVEDVRQQRDSLVFPGFVAELGLARLRHLPRYLAAAAVRLESLPGSAGRDERGMDTLDRVYGALDAALARMPEQRRTSRAVDAVLWSIEELRVSLFAQSLGTDGPISEKRVTTAIAALR